jgi:hypothetical protein
VNSTLQKPSKNTLLFRLLQQKSSRKDSDFDIQIDPSIKYQVDRKNAREIISKVLSSKGYLFAIFLLAKKVPVLPRVYLYLPQPRN